VYRKDKRALSSLLRSFLLHHRRFTPFPRWASVLIWFPNRPHSRDDHAPLSSFSGHEGKASAVRVFFFLEAEDKETALFCRRIPFSQSDVEKYKLSFPCFFLPTLPGWDRTCSPPHRRVICLFPVPKVLYLLPFLIFLSYGVFFHAMAEHSPVFSAAFFFLMLGQEGLPPIALANYMAGNLFSLSFLFAFPERFRIRRTKRTCHPLLSGDKEAGALSCSSSPLPSGEAFGNWRLRSFEVGLVYD